MHTVKTIHISRFADSDLERFSDCTVSKQFSGTTTIFDETAYDRRMGVFKPGETCETCIKTSKDCVGGFGIIKLHQPYIFPNNLKYVIHLVSLVCSSCGNLLINSRELFLLRLLPRNMKLFSLIEYYAMRTKKICKCGGSSIWLKDKQGVLINSTTRTTMDLYTIKLLLDKIDHKQLLSLGIKINPKALVFNNLPVISPYLRFYTVNQDSEHNDYGDISINYNNIVKDLLKDSGTNPAARIEMMLTNRKKTKFPNYTCKAAIGIKDLLQGKEGMITNNICGKRVDYSARGPITGGPEVDIGEVGVPEFIAKNMTVPICIESNDPTYLMTMYERWKPCKITKKNGKQVRILNETILLDAQIGDQFDRPLTNGDIVLFNRQPTLRPESMMAMRVKIVSGLNSFRLSVPCTTAFNADFDGDEMNMHVLQNIQAAAECDTLITPQGMIISSQKGTPIITPVQDGKLGLYLLTDHKCLVPREDTFDILFSCSRCNISKTIISWNSINSMNLTSQSQLFPGRFVISCLLSKTFSFPPNIKRGIICTSSPQWNTTLFSDILRLYCFSVSKSKACKLIDRIQRASYIWLSRSGFSLSMKDCSSFNLNENDIPEVIVPDTYLSLVDPLISAQMNNNNALSVIITSGAKGTVNNIIQISHALGQQSFDGGVIRKEMLTDRTLSCFLPSDESIESRGFIHSSFVDGLNLYEAIFHAKTGRKGVTDSVIKVADSGYLSKKICKYLEDAVICYDGSVRTNTKNKIIQFLVGGDGLNIQNFINKPGRTIFISSSDLKELGITHHNLGFYLTNVALFTTVKSYHPIITNLKRRLYLLLLPYCCNSQLPITTLRLRRFETLIITKFFPPGTAIGLLAGQNIGEVTSQLLLKSFHHSGIKDKDISTGVKRCSQLISSSKRRNQESVVITSRMNNERYNFLKRVLEHVHGDAKSFIYSLMESICIKEINRYRNIHMKDIVQSHTISWTASITLYQFICSFEYEHLNERLKKYLLITVNSIIQHNHHQVCMSDDDSVTTVSITLVIDNELEAILTYEKLLKAHIYTDSLEGTSEVKLNVSRDDFDLKFYGEKLMTVLRLPFTDKDKTFSSDPIENASIFGIEAGRTSIANELIKVLEYDGAGIDYRYISILCDVSCRSGKILGFTWSNLSESEYGPLCSAFFERAIARLNCYSINEEKDNCRSLTSGIFLGKMGKMGTGFFDIKHS